MTIKPFPRQLGKYIPQPPFQSISKHIPLPPIHSTLHEPEYGHFVWPTSSHGGFSSLHYYFLILFLLFQVSKQLSVKGMTLGGENLSS